jgi:hypothetical protein
MSDHETEQLLRSIACSEVNLPSAFASRVQGTTIGQLRKDAQQLALDLGYVEPAEPQARDQAGRFASTSGHQNQRVNDSIRRAAGFPTSTEQPEPPVGNLGLGVGAGATARALGPLSMNERIRNAASATRGVVPVEQLAGEGPL